MTEHERSNVITAILVRMTDLYHPKYGVLPGHNEEYEALRAKLTELEAA